MYNVFTSSGWMSVTFGCLSNTPRSLSGSVLTHLRWARKESEREREGAEIGASPHLVIFLQACIDAVGRKFETKHV